MKILVRLSDNVLDDKCFTKAILHVEKSVVEHVQVTHQGCYGVEDLKGKTLDYVVECANYDPSGSHPETYFEIWDGEERRFRSFWEAEQVTEERCLSVGARAILKAEEDAAIAHHEKMCGKGRQ